MSDTNIPQLIEEARERARDEWRLSSSPSTVNSKYIHQDHAELYDALAAALEVLTTPPSPEVEALTTRYIKESLNTHNGQYPEFTMDEIDMIRKAVTDRFGDEWSAVLTVHEWIAKEFARGHRCGVCGRTAAQNAAINYDCAREC